MLINKYRKKFIMETITNPEKDNTDLLILQSLLGQCNDTTEALIANLQEDALFWKMEYVALLQNIVKACSNGNGDLYNVIDHAAGMADIAKDSIDRSEAIM